MSVVHGSASYPRPEVPRVRGQSFLLFALLLLGLQANARPTLTLSQKQALAEAWHAGYHVGLPLAFTAIVYVESSGCAHVQSDAGIAFGCSQVQVRTAYKVTGAHIPPWMLSNPNLRTVNMAIGARYLQMCVDRFGWPVGAGCYEQGIPRTRILQRKGCFRVRVERIKPCREVRRYMASVLAAMIWLRNLPMSEE